MVYGRRYTRSRFTRRTRRYGASRRKTMRGRKGRRGTRVSARFANKVFRAAAELKGVSAPLGSNFGNITNQWTLFRIGNVLSDSAQANAVVGRSYYPTRIKFLNAVMRGGQTRIPTDDLWNIVRIVIFETNQETNAAALNSCGVGLDLPFTNKLPITGEVPLNYIKVYHDKLYTFVPNLGDTPGNYTPSLKKIYVDIRLRGKNYRNPGTADWNRKFYMAALSDSITAPSPAFISGSLLQYWKDDA